jgi:hypothetical protein
MQFDDPASSQSLAQMREETAPTPEKQAYARALADNRQDYIEQLSAQRAPIEKAVGEFAAETAGKTLQQSWHDRQTAPAARADDETELHETVVTQFEEHYLWLLLESSNR